MTTDRVPAERLYFLDWLRVIAMLVGLLYHAGRPFDFEDWHIKNTLTNGPALSSAVQWFEHVLSSFRMPLLFLVSGAATFFALRHRSLQG